jgi:Mg2+/Co2+ transporter CorB
MREGVFMLVACLLNLMGFALLALSQERHLERVLDQNHEANRPVALVYQAQRAIGFIAIGLSLPSCIVSQGASFGSLMWVVLMGAAAMAVALTLTWRPRWLRVLASRLPV